MGNLKILHLLFLTIFCVTSNATHEEFLKCMSHSTRHTNTSNYIHTQGSPSYSSLFQSSQQNPRWVNSTTQKPHHIITPYTEKEIQTAILCSQKHGYQVRILSGGHDYEGQSYKCKTPFIIIDLINLRSVNVDINDETAWVQSGATVGELYYYIAKRSKVHGFPAGVCPSVGVGGHFSGGGFGTMVRKYGLAADNVIDARLIDVHGQMRDRETMGEDLFWAIRGGGGASFGVIVAWKIKLVRVPSIVTVFNFGIKLDQGVTKLVHNWQSITHTLPKDLFIRLVIQVVDANTKNKTVKASFNSLYLGKINDLMPMMKLSFPELGLSADNCTEMSWIESVLFFAGYQRGHSLDVLLSRTDQYKSNFKAKSDFVTKEISRRGLEGIWKRLMEEETAFVILEPLGGRMNEISESDLPFPHRKQNLYNVQYLVKWEINNNASVTNKHLHWMRRLYKYMKPHVSYSPRGAYQNYRDLELGINRQANASYNDAKIWGEKYFKGNFKKLAQVKSKVDPGNFFRYDQSIPLL